MESDSRYDVALDIDEVHELPAYNRVKKVILTDIQRANDFYTSKIEPKLRLRHQIYEADRAYYRQRFRNTAAQSDFVSYDFWSMVQWAIPNIMNSFFGGDDAVVIVGRNQEDVPRAEVLKSLINFQLMTQNKGFLVLWDWFSDAFQYNLGAVKIWWERSEDWQEEHLEYVDAMTLMTLQMNEWCEIEYAVGPDVFGMYHVGYRIGRLKSNKPIIEPVRVTDLRWSPEAKSLTDANFVAHRQAVSGDHLRRQARNGVYDARAVEKAIEKAGDGGIIYGAFETELNDELENYRNEDDSSRAMYELYECYAKLDIKFLQIFDCLFNISILPALRAATQQQDDSFPSKAVINAVSRLVINNQFSHSVAAVMMRPEITEFDTSKGAVYCGATTHITKRPVPIVENISAVFGVVNNLILFHLLSCCLRAIQARRIHALFSEKVLRVPAVLDVYLDEPKG